VEMRLFIIKTYLFCLLIIILIFYFLEVYCPRPEFENVVIIQPKETYFYGDVVSYMCHDNKMFSAVCKSDGTWQPRKPSCDHSKNF
jgi:hypothetical protein